MSPEDDLTIDFSSLTPLRRTPDAPDPAALPLTSQSRASEAMSAVGYPTPLARATVNAS